ncbi:T-complex protein 11 X-linked protein 2-like [Meriones unguiculatus]|uniref:T-complex protein 11 X-linked protein 2-like n=1 Tax=Meriones unguiculatus TaxID=10047 RepID=UPI000B4F0E9F|nr:T-complex protein 11 X-linked protein 2-like [Meriones unguiculatus]
MPTNKKITSKKDSSQSKNGVQKPETSRKSQDDKTTSEGHCPESQPAVLSTEDIETVNEVSKLSIAHEIIVNQNFVVEENYLPQGSLENKFVETMYNAFWDHLKNQLSSTPPDFSCALELINNIKQILVSLLLPRQNHLRNEIEEALDMDLLKQETEHGALDVPHLSNYILNLMALMCAPVRDEAVQKLESIKDPVQLLRGITQVLDLMKMDMINYTIKSIRPYLLEHSIEYERAKFQELLDKQPEFLDCTIKWMTRAVTELVTSLPSTSVSPSTSFGIVSSFPSPKPDPDPPSLTTVLYQGYLNLVLKDHGNEEFPETLLMDKARLQNTKSKLCHLTVLASVLLVARSFSCGVLFSSPKFVDKLKRITKALIEEFSSNPEESMLSVSEQVSREIHQGLKDTGLTALSTENRASLVGQLQNIAKKENCIRSIIEQRIHLFLKSCLIHGMQESLLDVPGGLLFIEPELAELGWKFVNLMHHNQQVYNPYYAEILTNIISSRNGDKNDKKPVS